MLETRKVDNNKIRK